MNDTQEPSLPDQAQLAEKLARQEEEKEKKISAEESKDANFDNIGLIEEAKEEIKEKPQEKVIAAKAEDKPKTLPPSMQQILNKSNIQSSQQPAKPSMTGVKAYTFAVGRGNYPNHIVDALKARGNWSQIDEDGGLTDSNFYWRQCPLSWRDYDSLDERLETSPGKPIFINHFENNRGICTKTGLIKSLQQYYSEHAEASKLNYSVFDTTPTTFIISRVSDEDQINQLMTRYKEISRGGSNKECVPVKHCAQNMWLVKPASMNQGKGIELFRNLRDINDFIFQKNPQTKSWVVQKYVEHPFLFNGRKFDIRVWATVTEDYRIHFYKYGYLRTSSAEYNLKDKDVAVHLTNQCLQVKTDAYAQHEEGNTLSYDDLQQYFDEFYPQYNLNVEEMIIPRIKDIIIDTFLSVKKKMNSNNRKNCFELFGFDFLLDEDFRTWLIEVNHNPLLGTPNPYMRRMVPNMVEDMLKNVLDPILKPKNVPDPDRVNDFEIIYQDASEKHGPAVNIRRPFTKDLFYPIPELTPFIGKIRNNPRQAMNKRGQVARKLEPKQPLELGSTDISAAAYESAVGEASSSPRKEIVSSATPQRSKSMGPGKMFQTRRRTRGNSNYNSTERSSTSVSHASRPSRHLKSQKRKRNGDGIIEQVEEEDKMSNDYDSGEDENMNRNKIQVKKNLLCKNLLDQTKELCYQHSPVYKDFDQIFSRIMTRFSDWEIFDDKEIFMACQSLKVAANSGQIVNLVQEKNMKQIIQVYVQQDIHVKFRQEISELFLIIAKNIGLRKIFLNPMLHEVLVKNSLAFLDLKNATKFNSRLGILYQNAIKLLCTVCTAKKTQFYIPGETNLSERLRKRAFDSGTFTLLTHLFNELKTVDKEPFKTLRDHIKNQVLNYATLTDLTYHVKLLQFLIDNFMIDSPALTRSQSQFQDLHLQLNSSQEESKDIMNASSQQQQVDNPEYSIAHSASVVASPSVGAKSRTMKKTSSLNNYNANTSQNKDSEATQKQLYEVDTEKLLHSNDKVTITDLWKAKPQPAFPAVFLSKLDLQPLIEQANIKAATLQKKIANRKIDERRKVEQKVQKAAKQREEQVEHRRQRMEQAEKRKADQRKFAEELKKRAEQAQVIKQQQIPQQLTQQQQAQQLKQMN